MAVPPTRVQLSAPPRVNDRGASSWPPLDAAVSPFGVGKPDAPRTGAVAAVGAAVAESTRVRLAPATTMLVRPGYAIQFGVDATRAGVLELGRPELMAGTLRALHGARQPGPAAELVRRLTLAGLTGPAAASVVEDLLAFRILEVVPAVRPSVAVLGQGKLAVLVAELLSQEDLTVRVPLPGERPALFLARCSGGVTIGVDMLARGPILAAPVIRRGGSYLPVTAFDGRGIIGPLRVAGQVPCPLCVDLQAARADADWRHVMAQLPTGPGDSPAALRHLVAARAVGLAGRLARVEYPDASGSPPAAGQVIELSPTAGEQHRHLEPEPTCPACWEHARGGTTS